MANAKKDVKILVSAEDRASKELKKVDSALATVGAAAKKASAAVGVVAGGFGYVLKQTTDASSLLSNALIGLNSVARAFGQDTTAAKKAAQDLAQDGLMSVKEAADSLKNLLASRFSLPEAITLMNAFKDSAAFNRQASLGFGEAIRGATEGIKNQNSILVDNAGITRNLSLMLEDAGYAAKDLGRASTDTGVRMALYNGILKEASSFQGDAARVAETLSGKQAALSTQVFNLKAAIGEQLSPVMLEFVERASQAVSVVQRVTDAVKSSGGAVTVAHGALSSLLGYIEAKTGIITILKTSFENVANVFRYSMLPELQKFWEALQPLMPFLETFAKIMGVFLYGAIIAVVKVIEILTIALTATLTHAINVATSGIELFRKGWDAVTTTISKAIDYIDRLIDKIKSLNVLQGASGAISGFLGFGGARAAGGPVSSGMTYLVGERGPELFTAPGNGSIVPNNALGGGSLVINITGNSFLDSYAAEKMGDMIIQRLGLNARI